MASLTTISQERERTVESRIAALEACVQVLVGRHTLPDLQEQVTGQESACASPQERRLLPAEQRALIEYSAQGTYVIIIDTLLQAHLATP